MIHLGKVKPGSTVEFAFGSFAGSTGAPSATTGNATSDIQIYKDGGTTQRASASGVTFTVDFDTLTGVNYISIDLSDNTTADFYAAGSRYTVVVSDVTIDSQTMRFPVGSFVIGLPDAILDTTIATLASQTSFTLAAGSADNNAYVGCDVYVHDAASGVQCAMGVVSAYTGATKTVTLAADPGIFTMAAKDNISILPRRNTYSWNGLTTVALPLVPTVAGRTLDVSAGGEAGLDWANVGSPTTSLALTGTTIATTQKVDIETIKTNPVVNAGTVTFPTTATLASTTNITAGTVTTATNVTTVNGLAAGVITAASIAADAITDAKVAADVTIASVTGAVGSVTGNVGGNVVGSVGSVATAVAITSNQKKNQALSAFEFMLTDSTTHAPKTGAASIAATRSIDGAAFAAGTLSAVTEISNGIYKIDFGAGDLNGNVVTLRVTATACDDTFATIILQP